METLLNDIMQEAAPLLLELLVGVLVILYGITRVWVRRKIGLELEALNRDSLHKALASGAELVFDRKMSWDQKIDAVLAHAKESSPDAINFFVSKDGVIRRLAEAKLKSMLGRNSIPGLPFGDNN